VRFDLEEGFVAVEGDIDEKVFVRQNPLQSRGELLVVHHQNRFQFKSVHARLNFVWMPLKFHREECFRSAVMVPVAGSETRHQTFATANPSFGGSEVGISMPIIKTLCPW